MNAAVAEVIDRYPAATRKALARLRGLIYEVASETDGVGRLEETLKWGQPSYLTPDSGSGTTVRIDAVRNDPTKVAMFVNCQTNLVDNYRDLYPHLSYDGNRAVRFSVDAPLPDAELRHVLALALTYHRRKQR